ncbi:MAG: hypothetical protein ACM3TR_14105 [Caulobacteraceae bacterium]
MLKSTDIYTYGEAAVPIVEEDGIHLTYLCPFAYRIREDGSLQPIDDVPAISAAKSENAAPMLYTAHDYEAHGRTLDFVVLMTYEWGWRFGPPQAISPLNQIKRVLDYAVSVIPREKIFFGFQLCKGLAASLCKRAGGRNLQYAGSGTAGNRL